MTHGKPYTRSGMPWGGPVLNEEAWVERIRNTIEPTRGTSLEFVVCDVYALHGSVENAKRAVILARETSDKRWTG